MTGTLLRIVVFSTKSYDEEHLGAANAAAGHDLTFLEARLTPATARLADGHQAVCAFVNDDLGGEVLTTLAALGVELVLLRSAGFNHVELAAAERLGLAVTRVPAYSPHAVAEHAVALILTLNRKVHRAYSRVRDGNFSLTGLQGFDLAGKTVGVVGTGRIGEVFARIMAGFGCAVLAYDPMPSGAAKAAGADYIDLADLLRRSDIVSLHCPLTPETYHLIDGEALGRMRGGAMLINTSRGALVDTVAVIEALKSGKLGYLGLDVYEEEEGLFFEDLSDRVIADDVFSRLLTFPNVVITGHQAFFTREALQHIAETTLANATAYATGVGEFNAVVPALI